MTGSSVCAAGWVTVEVRGSLFSTAPSHSSKRRSKKGSDSEAPRQLAAAPTGFAPSLHILRVSRAALWQPEE